MSKVSKKAAWVIDLSFVFEECARVHELISNTPPGKFKDLPRSDVGGSLPHPCGRGDMTCMLRAPDPCQGPKQILERHAISRSLSARSTTRAGPLPLSMPTIGCFCQYRPFDDCRSLRDPLLLVAGTEDRRAVARFPTVALAAQRGGSGRRDQGQLHPTAPSQM
jgi:hypothetical protein